MDGRLWNKLYREIRHVGKDAPDLPRMGRPREYGTQDILAVWAFSAMMNWPISVTQHRLSQGATGWWLKRYWQWTGKIPCLATLTRRAKASDFRRLLRRLLRRLRRWQGLGPPAHVVIDSTFLLTGSCSRDPESRWACHGGKWFRGYALHVVCDGAGGLWAWHVSSANVQEMKVARRLIRQIAAGQAPNLRWMIADTGYDSERLHRLIDRRLHARLLAPVNRRGAKTEAWRAEQPGRDASDRLLATAEGQALFNQRVAVEHWNSWFKGTSHVSMPPYHARRLNRVRRWVDLKLAVFFVHQHLSRQELKPAA